MGIYDGHRDRLRARFLREGLGGFEEHTALELLLFYARPRCDTSGLARALIGRFGSFSAVIDAPVGELEQVEGVGRTAAVLLKLIPEMGAYYLDNRALPGEILDSAQRAGAFFMPKFFGKCAEEVWLAMLDDKRKVVRCSRVSEGGIVNAAQVTVKRVVAEAVNSGATCVLLAHNHPGGTALPSADDTRMTRRIYRALKYLGIELEDHIIVADGDFVSLAESGAMDALRREAE